MIAKQYLILVILLLVAVATALPLSRRAKSGKEPKQNKKLSKHAEEPITEAPEAVATLFEESAAAAAAAAAAEDEEEEETPAGKAEKKQKRQKPSKPSKVKGKKPKGPKAPATEPTPTTAAATDAKTVKSAKAAKTAKTAKTAKSAKTAKAAKSAKTAKQPKQPKGTAGIDDATLAPPNSDDDDACIICSKSNKQKITSLTVMYTENGANDNTQGFKPYGDLTGTFPSENVVVTSPKMRFETTLNHGDVFTVKASGRKSKFKANTEFVINGAQKVGFHTSCSVDLQVGDRFGPFTILGGTTKSGKNCMAKAPPAPTTPAPTTTIPTTAMTAAPTTTAAPPPTTLGPTTTFEPATDEPDLPDNPPIIHIGTLGPILGAPVDGSTLAPPPVYGSTLAPVTPPPRRL